MRERTEKFAGYLKSLGLKQGDVVSFVALNSENLAPTVFACFLIGLPVNPLASFMTESENFKYLGKTKPKLIICDSSHLQMIQKVIDELESDAKILTIMEDIDGYDSVAKILKRTSEDELFYPNIDPDSIAAYIISSGTTSDPKIILKTHRDLLNSTVFTDYKITEKLVILQSASIYWVTGIYYLIYSTIYQCIRIITTQTYNPKDFINLLINYKIATLTAPPFLPISLMQSGFMKPLENMRFWFIGGNAVSMKFVESFKQFIPNGSIQIAYGSTESNLIASTINGNKDGSCGQLFPNISAKIVNDDGNVLENLQKGEICIKKAVQFAGYFGEPETTRDVFDNDGWFKTGDIGYFDDEGFFYFVDRKFERIHYQAVQILPNELEVIINEIDGVLDSCVVGVLDKKSTNFIVYAFVIVTKSSELTENFVLNYVNRKVIDNWKLRGGVYFVDSFPIGISGKTNRKAMKTKATEIYKASKYLKN